MKFFGIFYNKELLKIENSNRNRFFCMDALIMIESINTKLPVAV